MSTSQITSYLAGFGLLVLSSQVEAGEPVRKEVSLDSATKIRVGETLRLKGTRYAITLEAFRKMDCAVPGKNCGAAYTPDPLPNWVIECEPHGVGMDCPYGVQELTKESDRATYTTIRVIKRKAN